jgi:alpha-beta hydrolase superfamily lysophospholipase
MNVVAFLHAYRFTHFDHSAEKTKEDRLSFGQKVKTVLLGINNPRPRNIHFPDKPFEKIVLSSNKKIECWLIKRDSSRGTVILFPGYAGEKSALLNKAWVFRDLGYNTLLVDFMGSGGSEGSQTTIGFKEAEEVKTCYDYIKEKGEKNIILFGTSMGAVAIMKAVNDYGFSPADIILECPFGSMLKTVQNRFRLIGIPAFPMANLLVFWGGLQNGFNAFAHNPDDYAKKIRCPTLLLYGGKDEKVSRSETDEIYRNLEGEKDSIIYPLAGHENFMRLYKGKWTSDITRFLSGFY